MVVVVVEVAEVVVVERGQHLEAERPEHLLVGRRQCVAHVVCLRRLRQRVELLDEERGGGAWRDMGRRRWA